MKFIHPRAIEGGGDRGGHHQDVQQILNEVASVVKKRTSRQYPATTCSAKAAAQASENPPCFKGWAQGQSGPPRSLGADKSAVFDVCMHAADVEHVCHHLQQLKQRELHHT